RMVIRLLQWGEDVVNGVLRSALGHKGGNGSFEVSSRHVVESLLAKGGEEMLLNDLTILARGGGLAMRLGIYPEPLCQIVRHGGDGAVLGGQCHSFAALLGPLQFGCQLV